MKRTSKQLFKVIAGLIIFLLVLGYAGSYERTEQMIYNMSQPTYEAIVKKLGSDASEKEIAREYTDNKSFYDTNY